MNTTFKDYESTITTDDDRKLHNQVLEARAAWLQAAAPPIAVMDQGKTAQAKMELAEHAVPAYEKMTATIDTLNDWNKAQGDLIGKAILASVAGATSGIWITIVLAILLGIGVAVFISRSVTRPVASLLEHVGRVGQGDLDSRCGYEAKDEIGQLASDMNKMTEDLKTARENEREKAGRDQRSGPGAPGQGRRSAHSRQGGRRGGPHPAGVGQGRGRHRSARARASRS